MLNEKFNNLHDEIMKIKYRNNYVISESPRYRPLIGNNEEFDEVPKLTNEAGEQEPEIKQDDNAQPQSNDTPIDSKPPTPSFDVENEPQLSNDEMRGTNPSNPEPNVDVIQNDIIKSNVEAMKNINDKLESLSNVVQGLNSKLTTLSSNVEEVREPTDSEKLMNKSKVSYPYYFNLNDFWQGNWFNEKRENDNEKGVKKLPDGTFVADFDDLPQKSKVDIQNSFNELI